MTIDVQLGDLGRQARNGFKTVQRLIDTMVALLDDAECDGTTPHCQASREDAETSIQEAEYFLKTGRLIEEPHSDIPFTDSISEQFTKGDERDRED